LHAGKLAACVVADGRNAHAALWLKYALSTPLHPPSYPHKAYDQHLNMILGDVEETTTTVEIDDETYEEIIKVTGRGACGGQLLIVSCARRICRGGWRRPLAGPVPRARLRQNAPE
jgi:hypothetical protein